jgi:hypothetical protein
VAAVRAHAVSLETLLTGLQQAISRLTSSPGDPFIPVFESLNWIVTIDEWLQVERDDRDWWVREPDGELVRALRFVRNRVHHQWADAIGSKQSRWLRLLHYGQPPPSRFPPFGPPHFVDLGTWVGPDGLPTATEERFVDPSGRTLYAERLAGRSVYETMLRVYQLFMRLPEGNL